MTNQTMSVEASAAAPAGVWSFPPARILAPVDFGEASGRALDVAAALAGRFGSTLSVLHADILEAPVYFTRDQASGLEHQRENASAALGREVDRFVRRRVRLAAVTRFVEESPTTAIVEAARHADLIVMGTHGRRGPTRWWLGSVAERIVRDSTVPVLVVRAGAAEALPAQALFSHPLVVAGDWTFDGEAERYAIGLAEAFGGTVAERTATCEEDLVREREATLLVVARSMLAPGWFGARVERLVRSCTLPMLFVPATR